MDYLELLSYRRSCRAFSPEPVTDEQIRKLLLAANGAPVGSSLYKDLQPEIEYSNAACLVLSMQMEAVQLGLSGVFIWGALEAMRVLPEYDRTDLLELPQGFEPLLGLAVGYAANVGEKRILTTDKISLNQIP